MPVPTIFIVALLAFQVLQLILNCIFLYLLLKGRKSEH